VEPYKGAALLKMGVQWIGRWGGGQNSKNTKIKKRWGHEGHAPPPTHMVAPPLNALNHSIILK